MLTTDTISSQMIEQLPRYRKATNGGEYSSACPFCNDGDDRFRFWPEVGNYWCRVCGAKGFVVGTSSMQLDPEALAEWQRREADRKAVATANTIGKIEALNQRNNVARYHAQLTQAAREWWHSKGLSDASIKRWQLGYTSNCPTAPGEASYTIPIFYQSKLYNIRHRLADAGDGNKYRPELSGLPAAMFNADVLADASGFVSEVVLVEGEIKAMVLQQNGFDAVAIPGAQTFKAKWIHHFSGCGKRVYVALDPGAEAQAERIWQELGEAGVSTKLCTYPVKPDDFFVLYGGTQLDFYTYMILAQEYRR